MNIGIGLQDLGFRVQGLGLIQGLYENSSNDPLPHTPSSTSNAWFRVGGLPRKPVTQNYRQLSSNFLLLGVEVAHYYGLLGFLGRL